LYATASGSNGSFAQGYRATASGSNGSFAIGSSVTASVASSAIWFNGSNDKSNSLKVGGSVPIRLCANGDGDSNGDIWFDGTDLKCKIGGTVYTITKT
jgi:hypothetical protein